MKKFSFSRSPFLLGVALAPTFLAFAHPASAQMAPMTSTPMAMATPMAAKPTMLNGIQETTLANGLTVLTKEVHTAPVAYFSIWYKAGSGNEQLGQSGMSHLLEHMMFKGTTTRKPGEISALLQQNGASFNASTFFDRTNYFETLASDRLDMAMQLEADRMSNSLFDEAEHQKEMTVVRSEYEGGENDPGSALSKAVRLSAFQVNPYRWQTIGFRSDIENISRDEMYAYYKKYYVPNNAVIVMVGDFDTKTALAKVNQYFGSKPRAPITERFITPEPEQQGERRVILNRAGSSKQVEIAYHIPAYGTPDRYALDVLETALSGGRTARFFGALIQSGLTSSADAYDYGLRDPDLFFLDATPQPGKTNAEVEKALLAEITKVQTTPISGEELTRVVKQAEAAYIFGKDSVQSQGSQLGENAMRGDWRFGETYLENLRKVTPADVQRVAQKYLVERNRTVGYFEPITPGNGAMTAKMAAAAVVTPRIFVEGSADASDKAKARAKQTSDLLTRLFGESQGKLLRVNNPRPLTPQMKARQESTQRLLKDLQEAAATKSSPANPTSAQPMGRAFTRANAQMKPAMAAPMTAAPAKSTRVVLPNGITVVVRENHANATVALSGALLSAGGVFDPADKSGLASFTASQLSRGTKTRSLLDIARILEGVGASANIGGGEEYASVSGRALSRDFATILDVLADEMRNPAFPAEEIEKSRAQTLAAIEEARQNTGALAQIAFSNALYPVGHPYHTPTLDEQAAIIKNLKREDLVAFHAARYAPDRLILTVVGDVTPAQAIAAITKAFGSWPKKGNLPAINIADVGATAGKFGAANLVKPLVIDVPDKAQADVIYGYPSHLKRSDPDFYRVTVLNTMLGGGSGLSSRLATNVRDKMGLVYGIYSGTDASLGAGPFTVRFGSNPANVDKAVAETRRQMTLAREGGFSPDEVAKTIQFLTGSYAVTLSTNSAVASQLLVAEIYGLGPDYIQKRNSYYQAVTPEQVNEAAKKYLDPALGTLVISGTYPAKG